MPKDPNGFVTFPVQLSQENEWLFEESVGDLPRHTGMERYVDLNRVISMKRLEPTESRTVAE